MKNIFKKSLAALLFVCMLLSVMNLAVFAVDPVAKQTEKQIVNIGGSASSSGYTVSKTVMPTGKENEFNINLTVQRTVTKPGDMSIVLVLDNSSSMADYSFQKAIKGALLDEGGFLDQLVANTEGVDHVYVSAVSFNTGAQSVCGWRDIHVDWHLDQLENSIINNYNYKNTYGTNIQAGLRIAYNTISKRPMNMSGYDSQVAKNAPNKYVILFTDGWCGHIMNDQWDKSYESISGKGANTDEESWNASKEMADYIRNATGATIYSVGHGDYYRSLLNYIATGDSADSSRTFNGGSGFDLTDLNNAFVNIAGTFGEDGVVTDPMGEYIKLGDIDASLVAQGVTKNNNALTWNLNRAKAQVTTNGNDITYTYSITYPITLNNTAAGFVSGKTYNTNGTTTLTNGPVSLNFPIPAVKGYSAPLSFNKVDANTNTAVAGAEFELLHDCCGTSIATKKAVSDVNGSVSFAGVPSAHTYTLVETKAPETHEKSNETSKVVVSYGVPAVSGNLLKNGVVTNVSKVSATVNKVWDDASNQDGKRADSVTVQLLANGEASGKAVTLSDANGWTYTWNELDSSKTYTVQEINVPEGYIAFVSADKDSGVSYSYTITNAHLPEKTGLNITKVWDDADNVLGKRPESITVGLLANGQATDKTLVLNDSNNWSGEFADLDKYNDGNEISYTVDEIDVPEGYNKIVANDGNSYTITNTLPIVSLSVDKVWDDADNRDGKRADSIAVQLLADSETYGDVVVLNEENSWTYTWAALDGNKVYTVEEINVPAGYTVAVSEDMDDSENYNYTITNSYTPEKTSLSVTKIWDDSDDVLNLRPDAVSVALLADGQLTGKTLTLNESNGWFGEFADLDKYSNGAEVVYAVEEIDVPAGYITTVESNGTEYTITNTLPLVPLTVSKVETGSTLPERQEIYQFRVLIGSQDNMQPLSAGVEYTVGGISKLVAEGGIIELKADETAELCLLAGSSYKVEEIINTDYTYRVYYENAEGTIALNNAQPVAVTVTNEYIVPDAAVVLTIDMSGTMYRYKMDGKRYVDVAKEKAIDFVTQYANSFYNEDDLRMLAVVAFDTDAKVVLNWVDINTPEGLESAKKAINGIKVADNGNTSSNQVCTNFDGGVILTRNLLRQSEVENIDKKFAIILSDGAPTVTVNQDTDTVGTIKSSFWGNQMNALGKVYQSKYCGGGWTHPAEVENTLTYMNGLSDMTVNYSTEDGGTQEAIFIIGVGGDMSFKLFNDSVYGTSNGSRTSDVKRNPAAFNNIDALFGYTQAEIMAMTTGDWMSNVASRVGGVYVSAQNSDALQNEFDNIIGVIKDITNP